MRICTRILLVFFVAAGLSQLLGPVLRADDSRPNILWMTAEDHGPHLGCYGDPDAVTPNLDALAAKGMLYEKAWSCLPVCAPARTAIITGMYPNSLGAEHMRSMVQTPQAVKLYPQILREAGYYCTNNSKEDYNVTKPGTVWDESSNKAHWNKRAAGQPFFAIFNFTGTHESQVWKKEGGLQHDPGKVRLPKYHPDLPEVRADWAKYHDNITASDARAGELLKELDEAGLTDDTIVFYYADHGSGLPRNKRMACNSGLHVPLIVHFPEKWKHLAPKEYAAGGKSSRLVNFVDLAPTLVSIIGQQPPEWMQGRAFAGKFAGEAPKFLHGLRGRMDARYDLVRSVTDGRFVYVRNFLPHLPHGQHVHYQFTTDTTRLWHEQFLQGKLNTDQALFWQAPRAPEELYDLQSDPDEVHNLAASPEHRTKLEELRGQVHEHLLRIRDVDLLPEAEMNARSRGQSPRDALAEDANYPIKSVLRAAETASNREANSLEISVKNLQDTDAGVRYWGVIGLRGQGKPAVEKSAEALLKLLKDTSPSVRIAAAETLGILGSEAQAISAAESLLSIVEKHPGDIHLMLQALNAVEHVGSRMSLADNALARIQAIPEKHKDWEQRAAGKPELVKQDILKILAGN